MSPWWKKPEPTPPSVLESVESVEVPLLTEVNRALARSQFRAAILHAYPVVSDDLSRAFSVPFPAGMTHEEFLRALKRAKAARAAEYLQSLYQLYAPIRYGPPGAPESPATLKEILKSMYAQRPMWKLYLQPREEPDGAPAAEASPEVGSGSLGEPPQ